MPSNTLYSQRIIIKPESERLHSDVIAQHTGKTRSSHVRGGRQLLSAWHRHRSCMVSTTTYSPRLQKHNICLTWYVEA